MPWDFDVVQRGRLTGGAIQSNSPRSIATAQIETWDISIKDTDSNLNPDDVTEQQILAATQLPEINRDVLQQTDDTDGTTYVYPWLIANSKRAERDRTNSFVWRVFVEYRTPNVADVSETDLRGIDVSTITDITNYPFLTENIWGEEPHIIYKEAKSGGSQQFRLPTGNLYSEPFRRRHPTRRMRRWQFESIADIDQAIEERLLTTNPAAFEGDPPVSLPDAPPRWMVTAIDYQPINDLPNTTSPDQQYLMTYTVERNSKDGGWADRRYLVDNHFLKTANDITTKEPYRSPPDFTTIVPCIIKKDGTLIANQLTDPMEFLDYIVQPGDLPWTWWRT